MNVLMPGYSGKNLTREKPLELLARSSLLFSPIFLLVGADVEPLSMISRVLLYAFLVPLMAYAILAFPRLIRRIRILKIALPAVVLLIYSLVEVLLADDIGRALAVFAQLLAVLAIIIVRPRRVGIGYLVVYLVAIFLISLFYRPANGFSLFINKNYAGMVIFFVFSALVILPIRRSWLKYAALGTALVLIALADSRSVMLAIAWWAFTYYFLQAKAGARAAFLATVILAAGCTLIYILAENYGLDSGAQVAGKSLETGRQVIWRAAIDEIKESPWVGYGLGALPKSYGSDSHYDNLSLHNHHLQWTYQTGLVGLLLFLWLLYRLYRSSLNTKSGAISGAFLLALIVQQSFEVVLTQNNLALALAYWGILSYGIGQPVQRRLRN